MYIDTSTLNWMLNANSPSSLASNIENTVCCNLHFETDGTIILYNFGESPEHMMAGSLSLSQ